MRFGRYDKCGNVHCGSGAQRGPWPLNLNMAVSPANRAENYFIIPIYE